MNAFKTLCRPIIFADACHRTEGYGGIIMSAVGLDADQGLWPLAYSFASIEDESTWRYFCTMLKHAMGDHRFVIMSDRHGALLNVVESVFDKEYHAHCFRHITSNYGDVMNSLRFKKDQKDEGIRLLNKIAYSWDNFGYTRALNELGAFRPELLAWVEANHPEHWANAKFPFKRWGWLTSNPAESWNNWLGKHKLRNKNVYSFMKDHLIVVNRTMVIKTDACAAWKNNCERKIEKWLQKKVKMINDRGYDCVPAGNLKFMVFDANAGHWT